jgi:two-component system cell cycle response regulator
MDLVDLSTWNVLAVDDEPDSLEVLIEALSMHDASVHGAGSGPEALRLLETLHPTLVITDLSMPAMDGYQLLHRIRHLDGFKGTPVVALTAHAMAGDRERILAAGFDGYVSKPLRIASLVSDLLAILPSLNPNAPVQPAQPEASPRPSLPVPMDDGPKPPTAYPTAQAAEALKPAPAYPAQPDEALQPAPAQPDEMLHQ